MVHTSSEGLGKEWNSMGCWKLPQNLDQDGEYVWSSHQVTLDARNAPPQLRSAAAFLQSVDKGRWVGRAFLTEPLCCRCSCLKRGLGGCSQIQHRNKTHCGFQVFSIFKMNTLRKILNFFWQLGSLLAYLRN